MGTSCEHIPWLVWSDIYRMKYCMLLLFVAAASGSPLGYYPYYGHYPLNLIQYVQTQPVVITLPEDIESDFQCEAEGSFANRENACKSYFVCIKKPATEGFSLTERACSPSLAFDTNLGVCNWEQAVTDC